MMIYPATEKHIKKYSKQEMKIIHETGVIYQNITKKYIDSLNINTINWVYNVLDHKKEVESIIYEDLDPKLGFMILPDR
jgi:m7GpppX diphosphatase